MDLQENQCKYSCCTQGQVLQVYGRDKEGGLEDMIVECRHRRSRRERRALMKGDTSIEYLGLKVLKSSVNRVDGFSRRVSVFNTCHDEFVVIGITESNDFLGNELVTEESSSLVERSRKLAGSSISSDMYNHYPDTIDVEGSSVNGDQSICTVKSHSLVEGDDQGEIQVENLCEARTESGCENGQSLCSYKSRSDIPAIPMIDLMINIIQHPLVNDGRVDRTIGDIDTTSIPFPWVPQVFSDWYALFNTFLHTRSN